jgi:hypothetical protein
MTTVTGQNEEFVLVPRKPTEAMLRAAWADAHDEDALGVWDSMISAYEASNQSTGKADSGNF